MAKTILSIVMDDNRLSGDARVLYYKINSLCKSSGKCWASNQFFAKHFNKGERSIIRYINELESCGYIKKTFIYESGTLKIKSRYITLSDSVVSNLSNPPVKNVHYPLSKMSLPPVKDGLV